LSAQKKKRLPDFDDDLSIREIDSQMNASTVPPPQRAGEVRGSGVRRAVPAGEAPEPLPMASTPPSPMELLTSERAPRDGNLYVEVEMLGHWVVGRLARILPEGLVVRGIHPFIQGDGHYCRLRVVRTNAEGEERKVSAGVVWRGYDEPTGEAFLEFEDPTLGKLISRYVRAALNH